MLLHGHTQSQCWEGVGDQVDEQQMNGVQQSEAHEGGEEYAQYLGHVGCQQELNCFTDVVVNAAAFAYSRNDGKT